MKSGSQNHEIDARLFFKPETHQRTPSPAFTLLQICLKQQAMHHESLNIIYSPLDFTSSSPSSRPKHAREDEEDVPDSCK